MTTKLIFNITLTIIIIYIFFIYNVENFEDTPETNKQIKDAINNVYLADVDAIRNLSEFTSNLQTTNKLTLPGQLIVSGEIRSTNCFASGNIGIVSESNVTILNAQIKQNGDIYGNNLNLRGTITNIGNITLTNGNINVSSDTINGDQIQLINTLKKNNPDQTDKWIISNTTGNNATVNTTSVNNTTVNTSMCNNATVNTSSGSDFDSIFKSINDVNNNKLSFTRMNGDIDKGSVLELYDNGNVNIPGNLEVGDLTTNYCLTKRNRARFIRVGNFQSTDLKELMINNPETKFSIPNIALDNWQLIEIRVFDHKGVNVSKEKNVSKIPGSGEPYPLPIKTPIENIVNGIIFKNPKIPSDNISEGYIGGVGRHLLQIDLCDEYDISHIELYNRFVYEYGNENITTRMNGTIVELISGKKDNPNDPYKPDIINRRIHTGIWTNIMSKEFLL